MHTSFGTILQAMIDAASHEEPRSQPTYRSYSQVGHARTHYVCVCISNLYVYVYRMYVYVYRTCYVCACNARSQHTEVMHRLVMLELAMYVYVHTYMHVRMYEVMPCLVM
jgi:hypothetical protein